MQAGHAGGVAIRGTVVAEQARGRVAVDDQLAGGQRRRRIVAQDQRQILARWLERSLLADAQRHLVDDHAAPAAGAVVEGTKVQVEAAPSVGAQIDLGQGPGLAVVAPGAQRVITAVHEYGQQVLEVVDLRPGCQQPGRVHRVPAHRRQVAQGRIAPEGQRRLAGVVRDAYPLAGAGIAVSVRAAGASAGAHGIGAGVADVLRIAGRQWRVGGLPGAGDVGIGQQLRPGLEAAVGQRLVAEAGVAVDDALAQRKHVRQRPCGQHLAGGEAARQQRLRRPALSVAIGTIYPRREARVPLWCSQRQVDGLAGRVRGQAAVVLVVVAVQPGRDVAPRVAAVGGAHDARLRLHVRGLYLTVHGPHRAVGGVVGRDGQAVVRGAGVQRLPSRAAVAGAVQ